MAGSSVINIGDVADLPTEAAKRLIDKGFAVKVVEKAQVKKAVFSKSTTKSKKK